MDYLDIIFGYYDKILADMSPSSQAIISLVLLIVLIFQIYHVIKSGHWIFILALIVLLPGTWPAAKHIGNIIITVIKFLLSRIQATI
ncbi:MAG: hypothetical protein WCT32_05760 [Patescibacteria group bacterium]|jgi:hypothetical protein